MQLLQLRLQLQNLLLSVCSTACRDLMLALLPCCIAIIAESAPNCSGELYGTQVPGFVADYDTFLGGIIPECGGLSSFR